ncbi:MAG: hypothetical protein MK212_11885 [Saprospiraceae bacterium]|nr:hypothetical protein [Saprospiraceae bacterium]
MQKIIVFGGIILCCLACSRPRNELANADILNGTQQKIKNTLDEEISALFKQIEWARYSYIGNEATMVLEDDLMKLHNYIARHKSGLSKMDKLRNLKIAWRNRIALDDLKEHEFTQEMIKKYSLDSLYTELRNLEKEQKKEALDILNTFKKLFEEEWSQEQKKLINNSSYQIEHFYLIEPNLDNETWQTKCLTGKNADKIDAYLGRLDAKNETFRITMAKCYESCFELEKKIYNQVFVDEIFAYVPFSDKDSLNISFGIYRRFKSPKNAYAVIDGDTMPFDKNGLLLLNEKKYDDSKDYERIHGSYELRRMHSSAEWERVKFGN